MGEMRNVYDISVGKLTEQRPRGRPRHTWKIILEWTLGK
jgi:hypothetical protein